MILISKSQCSLWPLPACSFSKYVFEKANAIDNIKRTTLHKSNRIIIYSAGSLIPIKGFHLAILSFFQSSAKSGKVSYVISGDGPTRPLLESLTKQHDVCGSVVFTGKISRREVLEYMTKSDIFLFPSFERGGMVVLEAMAAGLPVVCLDYGGPGEMVTDECGIKVTPTNPEQTVKELASALKELAHDPDLRRIMGEAGRRRAEQLYTWDKKGEFIKAIYKSVL